jgi:hypothetical protein
MASMPQDESPRKRVPQTIPPPHSPFAITEISIGMHGMFPVGMCSRAVDNVDLILTRLQFAVTYSNVYGCTYRLLGVRR